MDAMLIIWLIVIVGFLFIEILTPGFVSICFSIAAVPALILHLLGFSLLVQLIVYAIALAICLYYIIPVLRRMMNIKTESDSPIARTNLDLIIDATGVCLEPISKTADGLVKVEGKEWTAKVEDDVVINKDDLVIVKSITGSKIIVEKKEGE